MCLNTFPSISPCSAACVVTPICPNQDRWFSSSPGGLVPGRRTLIS